LENLKDVQHLSLKATILNIIDNQYQIGEKLLPELELCKQLNVSRTILRNVLDELQHEGYIQRIQGSGTIVMNRRKKYTLNLSKLGSAAEFISGYEAMNTDLFKIQEFEAGHRYAKILMVEPNAHLLRIERVRSLDGTPAIYTYNTIVKDRVTHYNHANLYAEIANSLSKTMSWNVETCDVNLRPYFADAELSELLHTYPGTSLLLVEETARQKDGLPLDYSLDYYVADLFDFQINRTLD